LVKKVFISQDGVDWKRDKWPWYGKLYLKFSAFLTAHLPNEGIFDNVIAKKIFEDRFKKQFKFITLWQRGGGRDRQYGHLK